MRSVGDSDSNPRFEGEEEEEKEGKRTGGLGSVRFRVWVGLGQWDSVCESPVAHGLAKAHPSRRPLPC